MIALLLAAALAFGGTGPSSHPPGEYAANEAGLKWVDIKLGTGPELGDTPQPVTMHYTGWLQDGTKFDSSVDRGKPFAYTANAGKVIAGWEQGLRGMRVGGSRQLVIPASLGYGERGAGGVIPPNATLIFEVELLSMAAQRRAPEKPADIAADAWTTSPTGLKFADITPCSEPNPRAGAMIQAEYTGWLADGTKFDSSYDRAQALTFAFGMGRVIKGWDQGLATMSPGCTRQLVIPSHLAYGERGAGALIPPGATLTFEIKLVSAQ